MKVSLIVTFRNEMSHLEEWWESLEAQTRLPDEVVIVDGGSDDGTWEFLQSRKPPFTLRLKSYPGSNISAGRNAAVRLAAHEVIAVTDGGCVLSPDWLAELTSPLERDPSLQVVAGGYQPLPSGFFQRVSACATLPRLHEIDPARFLPSARSTAYRRGVWEAAGGYPEWLAIGEDMFFNHAWKRMGMNYIVKKEAVVYWRLRPGPVPFFRQYYRYAWGDGRSGMYPRRHLVRYAVYAWALGGGILLGRKWWFWAATLPGAAAYAGRSWLRIPAFFAKSPAWEKAAAVPAVPALLFYMDLAKMAGYPTGVRDRLRAGWSVPSAAGGEMGPA